MAELSAELFIGQLYIGYFYKPDFLPFLFDESDTFEVHLASTTSENEQFGFRTTAEKAISKLERSSLNEDLFADVYSVNKNLLSSDWEVFAKREGEKNFDLQVEKLTLWLNTHKKSSSNSQPRTTLTSLSISCATSLTKVSSFFFPER